MKRRPLWFALWAVLGLISWAQAPAFDSPVRAGAVAATEPLETSEIIVFLRQGVNPHALARGYGLAVKRSLKGDADAYVLSAATVAEARAEVAALKNDPSVAAIYPNLRTQYVRMVFVPNDPYFHRDTPAAGWPGQWHLINEWTAGLDAGVVGPWSRDVTGLGVIIGICDDSLETTHPDLSPNYDAADSWDFGQDDPVPDPVVVTDEHGVSVAGVAAARGNNGIGTTGAAPEANLAGLRIDFDNQTTAMFVDATLYHSSGANTNIKVKNHSYGIASPYIDSSAEATALETSLAAGTVHCLAAGNERGTSGEDSNKKDLQNTPGAICVAALGSNGTYASYSCYGACVSVTAPSSSFSGLFGITTTDRTGEGFGYNGSDSFPDANYTSQFGGTSSATPLATGVMALVKQVQPALNGRFAKHLLAMTSSIVDPADASSTSDGGWRTNAAGIHFNQDYGFGLIDADALTLVAPQYSGVTALQTESTGTVIVGTSIPDQDLTGVTRTFSLTSTTPLEEVAVTLDISHSWRGDLEAYLTSPSGYTGRLMNRAGSDGGNNVDWTFTTNAFWGENPAGMWSLTVRDVYEFDIGTWNSYAVTARMGQLVAAPCLNPPMVSAINPTAGDDTGPLTGATVSGTNFVSGEMEVHLARAGELDIPGTNVDIVSSGILTCDFDLTGAQPGGWDVVVSRLSCSNAILVNGFTVMQPPPAITVAASVKNHGPAGPLALDVLPHGSVEPRLGGATQLDVVFDRNIQLLTGTNTDVGVSIGSVTGISAVGNQVQISLSDNGGVVPLQVSFPGVADAANGSLVVTDTLCFYPLAGDVSFDGAVDSFDLISARSHLGQTTTSDTFENDVRADGYINSFDLIAVRGHLGQTVAASCP